MGYRSVWRVMLCSACCDKRATLMLSAAGSHLRVHRTRENPISRRHRDNEDAEQRAVLGYGALKMYGDGFHTPQRERLNRLTVSGLAVPSPHERHHQVSHYHLPP